ncbi:hypothetical protein HYALB_00011205 [Hymenoscyphus albidus]|uniref:Protein-lysine N-methyltransferase EFM4 n=1 Tax=Hymenoscyphus albidus TaxID=595503 RepID=A0A9N9Q5C3_9HELO|nr:hypothetical protein HYALB_00011205 [Hymenoscyphus albidus]
MASSAPAKLSHLEPSPLGTKEYWDKLYTNELSNHALDASDIGTIWFNDSSAEDKILSYLSTSILTDQLPGPSITAKNCSFLDLGTGNGHFLMRLRGIINEDEDLDEEDPIWEGRMLGVDYSERSIEFAQRIARDKKLEGEKEVEFLKWDIMTENPGETAVLRGEQKEGWDVVLDKGTFDAISLSEEKDERGRRICEGYRERVLPLIREGGLLLVTSCNWTPDELKGWFVSGDEGEGRLVVAGEIAYRSFKFGGAVGQTISSVCFRKER